MKLILIAPSGGGKGSQADMITRDFGIPNISTGDLLRKHVSDGTKIGKEAQSYMNAGQWVPDSVMIDIITQAVVGMEGYILDGFPRTLNQAKALKNGGIDIDAVIELDVSDEMVMERLAGRWTCKNSECGFIWNENFEGFTHGQCGKCQGEIFQREDDKPETIARRLKNYRESNKDILDFYREQGKLFSIKVQPHYMPADTYKILKAHLDEIVQ